MIPAIFFLQPALPWLFAARCSAAYWQAVAETFAAVNAMAASADIVPFPPPSLRAGERVSQHSAEIVRFTPTR